LYTTIKQTTHVYNITILVNYCIPLATSHCTRLIVMCGIVSCHYLTFLYFHKVTFCSFLTSVQILCYAFCRNWLVLIKHNTQILYTHIVHTVYIQCSLYIDIYYIYSNESVHLCCNTCGNFLHNVFVFTWSLNHVNECMDLTIIIITTRKSEYQNTLLEQIPSSYFALYIFHSYSSLLMPCKCSQFILQFSDFLFTFTGIFLCSK
jgi:hypothetical protein